MWTSITLIKVTTFPNVYLLYVDKAKGSGSQEQQSNTVNHLSLWVHSLTSHAGRSFGFSRHIALVAWLSLQIKPLYSKSTSRKKNASTHPSVTLKKKSSIIPCPQTYSDGETSAKRRETLFWRACLFSALRFSINNRFSSAVSQIKASQLLSYPTQLWGEEASVARQNS